MRFFRRKPPTVDDAAAALAAACAGLDYPSEQDAPFDVVRFSGDARTAVEAIATPAASGAASGEVETLGVDDLFAGLSSDPRFVRLRDVIRATLREPIVIRVARVGDAAVQLYVVGRSDSGEWVGLHTTSIET